jgi:hypothetical protein
MLKQAIVAMLLAATGLTSAPTRAEDDQHLTGRDDSGAVVGADVAPGTTTTLTIVQDPSRTKTTGDGGTARRRHPIWRASRRLLH